MSRGAADGKQGTGDGRAPAVVLSPFEGLRGEGTEVGWFGPLLGGVCRRCVGRRLPTCGQKWLLFCARRLCRSRLVLAGLLFAWCWTAWVFTGPGRTESDWLLPACSSRPGTDLSSRASLVLGRGEPSHRGPMYPRRNGWVGLPKSDQYMNTCIYSGVAARKLVALHERIEKGEAAGERTRLLCCGSLPTTRRRSSGLLHPR